MSWAALSSGNLAAAQLLLNSSNPQVLRAAVSRAYYAAYAAICSHVCTPGATFRHGWRNPAHDEVRTLIAGIAKMDRSTKQSLCRRLSFLRGAREDADYRPGVIVDRASALIAIKEAGAVLRDLGVI